MTFGIAAFLWAALAGLIPVVLHMINRQHAPIVQFSTLRFLRISVQRTRRRKRLHDLMLLLLRVAALVMIALALAQPAVRWLHRWLTGVSSMAVVVIVDNSGSLATRDENGPRWDRVTSAAQQILDELQEGDQVALLVTNGRVPLSGRGLMQNHELVRQAVRSCRPSFERADLVAALAEARRLLAAAPAPTREIYIVTDMQACCWENLPRQKEASAGDGKRDGEPDIPIVIVDVRGPRLPNTALADIAADATAPVAGVPLRVAVGVQGDAEIAEERHVSVHVDGQKRDTSPTLRLEPAQLVRHMFRVALSGQKLHRGHVQLEGEDACPTDDRLYFAAHTDPGVAVAIVRAAEHEIQSLDQAYYLQRALTPQDDPAGAIVVSSLDPVGLTTEPLTRFAMIYCVNLPVPDPDVAQRLVAYVEAGGHLIWIGGDNVDPVAYSALNDRLQGRLLPTRLTGVHQVSPERPDGWHITWIDPHHRAVAPFAEPASIHQGVQVLRFIEMASVNTPDAQVLARLDEGQPLLAVRRVGAGSTYFLATSLHVDWTNFPLTPLFLPFVCHLTFELAGAGTGSTFLSAGAPWHLPVPAGEDVMVEVVRPNGDVVRVERPDTSAPSVSFEDTRDVGVYEVRVHRGTRVEETAFAVNPDPDEAAPSYLTGPRLEQDLAPARVFFCSDATQVTQTIRDLRKGWELGGAVLLLVLVALVAETFHANRREYRVAAQGEEKEKKRK
jgi:hypothetical protein